MRTIVFVLAAAIGQLEAPGSPRPDAVHLEVPFVPQGRLLCGGASVAMVLRYWGEKDVYAEDFSELVREDAEGISTLDLVTAVRERGFRAFPLRAEPDLVRLHLSRARPVVALLRTSANAFHYVVITGYADHDLVLHDPSIGPDRNRSFESMRESWAASNFWSLLILPSVSPSRPAKPAAEVSKVDARRRRQVASECRGLVDRALALRDDLGSAEELLTAAAELCPEEPLVFRELAAIRFLDDDWTGAAAWAEVALELEPEDGHAGSLLAASRLLSGDREGALEAWNSRGEPRLDLIEVSGLERTRQEVLYRYLSMAPGGLLTAEGFRKARRRLADLPTLARTRLSFEPLDGGRAKLVAAVSERSLFEPMGAALLRGSVDALAHRTTRAALSSPTGGGESLEAGFRWRERRPKFWVSLTSPRIFGLPGIGSLEGFLERQSYSFSGSGGFVEETWRGARLTIRDWLSSSTRAEWGVGLDQEASQGAWIAVRGGIEKRFATDRVSLRAGASRWFSTGAAPAFHEVEASVAARSLSGSDQWSLSARLDARAVSDEAPFSIWPGAGSDDARPLLLRGYPLLDDGVITGEGFGPRLLHGSIEGERTLFRPGIARVGLATFLDWAWVSGRPYESPQMLSSPGAGLRFHVFGHTVRLDGATTLTRGGFILSAGWVETW